MKNSIQISTYHLQYQTQVINLILNIQQKEFGVPITLEQQPDLLKIRNFYQQGKGNFWVALDKDKVIGTIAAIDLDNKNLALRKMFVNSNYRGYGVGNKLLNSLVSWAEEKNVKEICLGTIDKFKVAHKFYEKNGFIKVTKHELPEHFPIMLSDNIFYSLKIKSHQITE
ncbi:GCN5-related N-acetyltransferase [Calothrix parasitica NIES-267]|uniref:GCN5-related N-acetyltransferase n=1 Tax=Calothrix parasitica NIES-267 TaxID=1973488 RepID=A0A1Z4LJE2_9CYAN|nr:GCN5-related N-acetyltransferase [Calothrix parasitica NIES-267]